MNNRRFRAMAAAAVFATISPHAFATDTSKTTDPGFVPSTGQINPGKAPAPWSATRSLPQDQQPSQEDARAALMHPDPVGVSALGEATPQTGAGQATTGAATNPAANVAGETKMTPQSPSGSATTQLPGANGATSPTPSPGALQSPNAAAGQAPAAQAATEQQPASANGNEQSAANANGAVVNMRGPIGATLQTMPAKFSERNDLLDHMPIMAWPLRLDEQQRHKIYETVMAQPGQPVTGVDHLKPAASLTFEQTEHLTPLPAEIANIDGLQGLSYVKGKNRVLLVRPSTRIIVDEITM